MPQPSKTAAELLAECWRVVRPEAVVSVSPTAKDCVAVREDYDTHFFRPNSIDTYSALVAAMSPGQRAAFDQAMEYEVWERDAGGAVVGREFYPRPPSETLTAPTATHLAACCVALGVSQ